MCGGKNAGIEMRGRCLRRVLVPRSGKLWLVADSPFSYATENDRYLAFADLLHDILGVDHAEEHLAMLRVEDLNPMSDPDQMRATLRAITSNGIPFAFGFVPFYVNPTPMPSSSPWEVAA